MQIHRSGIITLSKTQRDMLHIFFLKEILDILILIYVPRGMSLGHDTWKGTWQGEGSLKERKAGVKRGK